MTPKLGPPVLGKMNTFRWSKTALIDLDTSLVNVHFLMALVRSGIDARVSRVTVASKTCFIKGQTGSLRSYQELMHKL